MGTDRSGKTGADIGAYEFGHVVHRHGVGVNGEMVACRISPHFVGVEIVVVCAEFVGFFGNFAGFLFGDGVAAAHYACYACLHWRVDKYIYTSGKVAQHIVGRTSDNHT